MARPSSVVTTSNIALIHRIWEEINLADIHLRRGNHLVMGLITNETLIKGNELISFSYALEINLTFLLLC